MLDCHLLGENTGENITFTWESTINTKIPRIIKLDDQSTSTYRLW